MELGLLRLNALQAFTCAILLLLTPSSYASKSSTDQSHEHFHQLQRSNSTENDRTSQTGSQSIQRRQDNGFDFMSYFMGRNAQSQQQAAPKVHQQAVPQVQQQAASQVQQQALSPLQHQHLLQQQLLQQQQQRQQDQLQQLQQQQLLQIQQQQTRTSPDLSYQDNTIQQQYQPVVQQQYQPAVQQQYQPQTAALNRDGGYGDINIGTGYSHGYAPQPKEIGISIGKPIVKIGNILSLLPKIFNTLSTGGKVMFGVELGNNFYFGPVGAKPLHKF